MAVLLPFDHTLLRPAPLVEPEETHLGRLAPQQPRDLQLELALMRPPQRAGEGAVLDALQPVVEAGVRHPHAQPVARDVIDDEDPHDDTPPSQQRRPSARTPTTTRRKACRSRAPPAGRSPHGVPATARSHVTPAACPRTAPRPPSARAPSRRGAAAPAPSASRHHP